MIPRSIVRAYLRDIGAWDIAALLDEVSMELADRGFQTAAASARASAAAIMQYQSGEEIR